MVEFETGKENVTVNVKKVAPSDYKVSVSAECTVNNGLRWHLTTDVEKELGLSQPALNLTAID
ncbi:MAG: hypothetical protein QF535_03485 [Anaerolineales bacterium]|nr:hypothetical protein [Anaerolineales bacterium]